jgi:hypothetical protein
MIFCSMLLLVASIFIVGMESPKRTNDEKISPTELLDDVDLELGVCPYWICSYGCSS